MTYGEMVDFIGENPGVAVTHRLFDDHEFIFMAGNGKVYDEQGYLFEDWNRGFYAHDGIRIRDQGPWLTDWSVKIGVILPEKHRIESEEKYFQK